MANQTEDALTLIATERHEQQTREGYTPEHDDEHGDGALAFAAACYAYGGVAHTDDVNRSRGGQMAQPYHRPLWPWATSAREAMRDKPRLRQLVIAGALIVAEIERLQRCAATGKD